MRQTFLFQRLKVSCLQTEGIETMRWKFFLLIYIYFAMAVMLTSRLLTMMQLNYSTFVVGLIGGLIAVVTLVLFFHQREG